MDCLNLAPTAADSASRLPCHNHGHRPSEKTRAACDRCHTQKLRCVKAKGKVSCDRCLKLKTSCKFSPRAFRSSVKREAPSCVSRDREWQPNLPAISRPSVTEPLDRMVVPGIATRWGTVSNAGIGDTKLLDQLCYFPDDLIKELGADESSDSFISINVSGVEHGNPGDWNNRCLNRFEENMRNPQMPFAINMHIRSQDHNENRRNNSGLNSVSNVRKLTLLNLALHDCAEQLPLSPSTTQIPGKNDNGDRDTMLALDTLLNLTSEFIEILKGSRFAEQCRNSRQNSPLFPAEFERAVDDPSSNSFACSHESQWSGTQASTIPLCGPKGWDEETMSIATSCHSYLVEIYASVFRMIQDCIKYALVPKLGKNWTVFLPSLKVGSFSSPLVRVDSNTPVSPGTSSTYILMLTMFSWQFWRQIEDIIRGVVENPSVVVSKNTDSAADTMWITMKDRTSYLLQTISIVKGAINGC